MSHHKQSNFISGILHFSGKKILLKSGENSYFVRFGRGENEYIHGDKVRARIKTGRTGPLQEVEIVSLESRSREILIAEYHETNEERILSIIREFGKLKLHYRGEKGYENGTLLLIRIRQGGEPQILSVFASGDTFDREEKVLFYTAGIDLNFPQNVLREAQQIQKEKDTIIQYATKKRTDFRNKFVFTIDGADAKDLDDAISIERDTDRNYILGVHIADVAEYIREDSHLDREALARGTSTYTPGKVVPMLPEEISNDLCSLHPGEPKLVLSCIMTIDRHGIVKKTELVEGIIKSAHRGVYEEIQKKYEGGMMNDEGKDISRHPDDRKDPEFQKPGFSPTRGVLAIVPQNDETPQTLTNAISLSYELYNILKKRRKKEGKIIFEGSEMYFEFGGKTEGKIIPKNIKKRTRVEAHMLIEEFMVLANEEVAKWCERMGIPFLSRVHGLPPYNSIDTIRQIIATHPILPLVGGVRGGTPPSLPYRGRNEHNKQDKNKNLEPHHIREFLDTLNDTDLYKYSRLLLPKMAKAEYRDKKHRHFGLALEYYSHFTSPIRRYPDLQIHRIIKEKIQGKLDTKRILHYAKILKKVARHCSERERLAEDTERAFDSLYAVRYMANYVGEQYTGRVSGIAEFAYFVELDSGVEVTVYLPRYGGHRVDDVGGTLTDKYGRTIVTIGDTRTIKITDVLENERRIVGE